MSSRREHQLKSLLTSESLKIDLYKFHQDRAEKIRSRLWTTLAWMASLQGAILAFMFDKLNFRLAEGFSPTIEQPKMAFTLSVFGVLFAFYMLKIIDNGTAHIESNRRYSDIAIGKNPLHTIRDFKIRIQDSSFTEMQVMRRLVIAVIAAQTVLVAVSAWSLVPSARPAAEPARSSPPAPEGQPSPLPR
jgi:hypothetical protein